MPVIEGADGRSWKLSDPQSIIDAFNARHSLIVVDWEHSSEARAPQGLEAPAAGWIDALELRDDAIWGKVTWTDKAAEQITAKEYRYLSPVFTYDAQTNEILELCSIGLTNQPNLPLPALNRKQEEAPVMTTAMPADLRSALSLHATANDGDVINAIQSLKASLAAAQNRSNSPPLERFVPRADYDTVLSRAANAETALATYERQARQKEIDGLIQQALTDGKISPASVEYHTAACSTDRGVGLFREFLKDAPPLVALQTASNQAGGHPAAQRITRAAYEAMDVQQRAQYLCAGGKITD